MLTWADNTVKPVLNGTWTERNPVLSGELSRSRGNAPLLSLYRQALLCQNSPVLSILIECCIFQVSAV